MNKVPTEVLCIIFLKALPSEREGDEFPEALTRTQLYISHVCQRWRDVALSFGELWSYLQLNLGYPCRYHNKSGKWWKCSTEIFHTWLLRSKHAPLNYMVYDSFSFRYLSHHDHLVDRQRDLERIILALISEQHHWKHIRIKLSGLTVSPDFPGFVLTESPNLISLELSILFGPLVPTTRGTINLAQSLQLKRLIVVGDFDLDTGNVPINTLTEARLWHRRCSSPHMPRPQAFLEFLRSAPFLIKFCAIPSPAVSHTTFDSLNGDHVLASRLRSLRLPYRSGYMIIDKLTLPSLENLAFANVTSEEASPILRHFLERSRPPLTRLHISNGNADTFIPILKLLPALEFLKFQYMGISEHFFRELVIPVNAGGHNFDHSQCILRPSLAGLVLSTRARDDKEARIAAIFSMVTSRAKVFGTFKTVERIYKPMTESPN